MRSHKDLLLLTYSSELQNGEPVFFSSNCLPIKAPNFEPAGHSFHSAALKLSGFCDDDDTETDTQSVLSDDRSSQDYLPTSDSYGSKGKKKSSSGSKQKDHYSLLGLGHLRFLATEEQIRKSYRETALKYHPDKQAALIFAEETEEARQTKKDEIESHFKAIQEAYEVLIDPEKRRIYDSTDEFDDDIPTDCTPQDFFKVFGPAFMRNGKWSVNQPIPSLGDDNTPIIDVDSFYNFWYTFKSWREFPHADDFDLEQAESRDHKRWMERQNSKLREKARKEEYARVRTLVDNAYKRDPRILRRKEEEKAEKQRIKEEKSMAKKLYEEEVRRAAEEERQQKEEEERKIAEAALIQKRMKEKEKKLLRKERSRLRTLSAPLISDNLLGLSDDIVESICMSFKVESLRLLCDNMDGKEKMEKAKLLRDASDATKLSGNVQMISLQDRDLKPNRTTAAQVKVDHTANNFEKKDKLWEKEEIEMLKKAIQKYPKGTSRRWEVISEYIGTGRSVEEILKATKTVLLQKPDSGKAFDSFLEKRKPVQTISSPLSTRVAVDEVSPIEKKIDGVSSTTPPKHSTSTKGSEKPGEVLPSTPEQDTWTEAQERALIQALKTFPKDANQRWERVAAAVPGKTMVQCKKKFTLMKESFRNKKSTEN
ncbi:dnaJ homolog subfamily C member 2-like [Zingiber officinale]|uniref:dnaJ homolog subfamily C member 2-like n=1 Tax=Zingiber officinale TaxID=94328 RepID=UPI001C4BD467|nr:dnaJ homolog subfamily C member 2-like [Zingiber officinale]